MSIIDFAAAKGKRTEAEEGQRFDDRLARAQAHPYKSAEYWKVIFPEEEWEMEEVPWQTFIDKMSRYHRNTQ